MGAGLPSKSRHFRYSAGLGFLSLVLVLVLWISGSAAADERLGRLERTIAEIEEILDGRSRDKPLGDDRARLIASVAALDASLGDNFLAEQGRGVVQFYRARSLLELAFDDNSKETAEAAIAASEAVLTVFPDAHDAAYLAGLSAYNILKDEKRAYGYWRRCAAGMHAGCVNTMASARLTGDDGSPPNAEEAISWHERVVATGTKWTCAGSFSAREIAEILFWRDGPVAREKALEWLTQARAIFAQLRSERPQMEGDCLAGEMDLIEYLIRGADDPALLTRAEAHGSNVTKNVVALLTDQKRQEPIADDLVGALQEHDRCRINYFVAGHHLIRGEQQLAAPYAQALQTNHKCKPLSALLRLRKS